MPRGTPRPISPLESRIAAIIRGQLAQQQRRHADLAAALGVSRNQLSRMLNGRVHINIDQLAAMCDFLGLHLVDVMREAEKTKDEEYGPLAAALEMREQLDMIGPPDKPDERPEAS